MTITESGHSQEVIKYCHIAVSVSSTCLYTYIIMTFKQTTVVILKCTGTLQPQINIEKLHDITLKN